MKGDSLNGLKFELKEAQNDINDFKRKLNDKLLDLTMAYECKEKDHLLHNSQLTLQKEKERIKIIGIIAFALLFILVVISSFFIYSRRKNIQLSKLLKENSFLIGESNHRIKNNLQLIVPLIGRELYKSKKTNPELQEISDKIKTIAVLHQHLYVNDSREKISIPVYLKSIEKNIKSALIEDEIELNLQVDDFELPIEKSVYLGLLITELITNSLKHAFSTINTKNININVQQDNDNVLFHYKDNGAGLAKGEAPHLVDILTTQLKSEVHIVSDLGYQLKLVFKK